MHLFNFFTGAENAFIAPEVLKVVTADPLTCRLVVVIQCGHEAVLRRQVLL